MHDHLWPETCGEGLAHVRKAYKYADRCCSAWVRMDDPSYRLSSRHDIGWQTMRNLGLDPVLEPAQLRLPSDRLADARLVQIRSKLERLFATLLVVARCRQVPQLDSVDTRVLLL
jgi:hypothetical protein